MTPQEEIVNVVTANPGITAAAMLASISGVAGMPDLAARLHRLVEGRQLERFRQTAEIPFAYFPFGKVPTAKPQPAFKRPDPLAIKQVEFYSAAQREASAIAFVKKYPGCTAVEAAAECKEFDSPVVAFVELSKLVTKGLLYAVAAKEETQFYIAVTKKEPEQKTEAPRVELRVDTPKPVTPKPVQEKTFEEILSKVEIDMDKKKVKRRDAFRQEGSRSRALLDAIAAHPGNTIKYLINLVPAIGTYGAMAPAAAEMSRLGLCNRETSRAGHSREYIYFPVADPLPLHQAEAPAVVEEIAENPQGEEPLSELEEEIFSRMVNETKGIKPPEPEPVKEPQFVRERAQAGEFFHADGFLAVCVSDGSVIVVDTASCTSMRLTRVTIQRLAELTKP